MDMQQTIRNGYDAAFGGSHNVGTMERIVSVGFGLAMAAGGLRRGADLPGTLMGLAGAALVARGMTGHCAVKAMMEDEPPRRIGGVATH